MRRRSEALNFLCIEKVKPSVAYIFLLLLFPKSKSFYLMKKDSIIQINKYLMIRNLLLLQLLWMFCGPVDAQYYVSPGGSDANPGTFQQPFKTIQKAANLMVAGDTCYIRGGIYHEMVTPVNSGTLANPLVFTRYASEKVIVTGTDSISGWVPYQGGIYKVWVPDSVMQLMVNRKPAHEARYPNFQGNFLSLNDWRAVVTDTNRNAVFSGTNFPSGYWVGGYVQVMVGSKWVNQCGKIDASNGNQVHCSTTSYPWGTTPAYSPSVYTGSGSGYIIGHLNALDTINEWHWQNDTLYYYPQSSSVINTLSIQARTRLNGFNCYGKQYIKLENLHFVMATVNFEQATGCTLQGGSVVFPTPFHYFSKAWGRQEFDTLNFGLSNWTGKGIAVSGFNNTVKDCYIAHSWGDGVSVGGQNHRVENCLIEDCNWSGTDYALISTVGSGHQITRNTIRRTGRSALVNRLSNLTDITYNDMYDCGLITHDLGITYSYHSNGNGSHIAYNWVHDNYAPSSCMGIYLDNYDTNYVVHHNVIWKVKNAIQTNKPAVNHQIYNNTAWYCTVAMGAWGNTGTTIQGQVVKNNLSDKAWSTGNTFSNNLVTSASPFTQVSACDFTLAPGSSAIDYGVHIPGITNGYSGAAPDAGAYEFGVTPWVPGTSTVMPDLSEMYLITSVPDSAKILSGTFKVCQGESNVLYTVEPVINATSYQWTLPNGATGITAANTIIVNFSSNAASGNISVVGINSNGTGITSVTRSITVNPAVAAAGPITGPAQVCQNQSATYSIATLQGATSYAWTLPNGATGSSNTHSITIQFGSGATTGYVAVKGINPCGEGISDSMLVTVMYQPPAPQIVQAGDTLFSNAAMGNQWYCQSTGLIPGAFNSWYTPVKTDWYYVLANLVGCPSDTSNKIYFVYNGIVQPEGEGDLQVFPNPTRGSIQILCSEEIMRVECLGAAGQYLLQKEGDQDYSLPVGLTSESGFAILRVITTSGSRVIKVVKI